MQYLLVLPVRIPITFTIVTNLVLYVKGAQHPSELLTMDCSSPFGATRAYETFSSTGIHHDDRAHMITLEIFTKGFTY
jgi:hypothetical protein